MALLVFAAGKPFYAKETLKRTTLTPEDRHERFVVFRRIIGLFIVVMFFWSIFDQAASTWTLFARDCLDLNVFGMQLAPDQIQSLNPVLILILLPPITLLWHFLAGVGIRLRPTDKMLIGFCLTGISMLIMSIAGFRYAEVGRVSVLWEVIPYIVITTAEVCISVVGLHEEFCDGVLASHRRLRQYPQRANHALLRRTDSRHRFQTHTGTVFRAVCLDYGSGHDRVRLRFAAVQSIRARRKRMNKRRSRL
jgi:energy-converting hydrogenase Eha subunit C